MAPLDTTNDRVARAVAVEQALEMLGPDLTRRLQMRPAALREAAAELSDRNPKLVEMTLEQTGLELFNRKQMGELAQLLRDWYVRTSPLESKPDFSGLSLQRSASKEKGGVDLSPPSVADSVAEWTNWIERNRTRAADLVLWTISQLGLDEVAAAGLARFIQGIVDRTISGQVARE